MNVCCNWNEQMLQYCSTVFNNRLLCYFSPLPLSVLSPVSFHFPLLAHSSFSLLPFSLPRCFYPIALRLTRLVFFQTLCSVLWLCWVTKVEPCEPWRRWTANPTSRCLRGAMKWRCPTPAHPMRVRMGAPITAPTHHARPCLTTHTSFASPSVHIGKGRATTANPNKVQGHAYHAIRACLGWI